MQQWKIAGVNYKNPCQGRLVEKFHRDIVTHHIRIREFTICLVGKFEINGGFSV